MASTPITATPGEHPPRRRRKKAYPGIPEAQIDKVMRSDRAIQALLDKASKVQEYWQSIAPVFAENDYKLEHRRKPAIGEIGDYQRRILVYLVPGTSGSDPYAIVRATDWKSRSIEFGVDPHFPPRAPCAKTKARFSR